MRHYEVYLLLSAPLFFFSLPGVSVSKLPLKDLHRIAKSCRPLLVSGTLSNSRSCVQNDAAPGPRLPPLPVFSGIDCFQLDVALPQLLLICRILSLYPIGPNPFNIVGLVFS